MDLQNITGAIAEIAQSAGQFIRAERSKISNDDIELKGKASLVTYVDKETEKMIVNKLRQLLPEAGFITEEGTAGESGEEYKWVIDPLDGTTNFIHGIFPHSVSIALTQNNSPVAGVVYEIGQDELFAAWKNGGAYLNGESISVSKSSKHEDVLLATGFPYYNFEKLNEYLKVLEFFMIETRGMRRMGSAAVDLAYVACGRFDGFFEHALHAWDVAAGVLLVQEAGGKVSDFKGGDNYLFGKELVAANAGYFPAFFAKINQYLG
ncbi:inositol monophosphatase family protein [Mangrovibacterium marinum]|uniref:Inositol-1-monophosphatase n=1 Tax=Mangrovibacterium marinum TaxID=1639118 RepID=A0A2T5BX50_9BACT|nr:inositol monophosphatase family protein [Mangrovibacterium marinum]PTN04349.1 myo-inositol-1(or 4)-monophosphatase [Mangrovibacterium marinum]